MTRAYIIRENFEAEWVQGKNVSEKLLDMTRDAGGLTYLTVHGDPVLGHLDDHNLLCYFIYTLSSWWEIPLIDRINSNRQDNNFAIIMDINPAPETYYRLGHREPSSPETRYKTGLKEMFPSLENNVADAMYNLLRNGFGHNLFGREPGKIRFDNEFDCPPKLDDANVLLVPPIPLALSMVTSFLPKIAMLLLYGSNDRMQIFKMYMSGKP